jgi:hypothetical protein
LVRASFEVRLNQLHQCVLSLSDAFALEISENEDKERNQQGIVLIRPGKQDQAKDDKHGTVGDI